MHICWGSFFFFFTKIHSEEQYRLLSREHFIWHQTLLSVCNRTEVDILSSLCNLRTYTLPEGQPPGKLFSAWVWVLCKDASFDFWPSLPLLLSLSFSPSVLFLSLFSVLRKMVVLFIDGWHRASVTCRVWLLKSARNRSSLWHKGGIKSESGYSAHSRSGLFISKFNWDRL